MSDSFVAPWTVALQGPLSMGFPRQECWNRLPFPTPGDLPNPRIKLASLTSPALADGFFTTSTTWEAPYNPHLLKFLDGSLFLLSPRQAILFYCHHSPKDRQCYRVPFSLIVGICKRNSPMVVARPRPCRSPTCTLLGMDEVETRKGQGGSLLLCKYECICFTVWPSCPSVVRISLWNLDGFP